MLRVTAGRRATPVALFVLLILAVEALAPAGAGGQTSGTPPPPSLLLPPAALKAGPLDATAHPWADRINAYLRQAAQEDFEATSLTRADYLRVIEGQIRAMRAYQDGEGRIIDPVEKKEMYYATPCYAHGVAVLAASGQVADAGLIESGMKALDVSVQDMSRSTVPAQHGDFFTWPAMFAYELFQNGATDERIAAWARDLDAVDPRNLYRAYLNGGNNWGVVNLAGEYLRHRAGFTSLEYVEKSLASQRSHFTELGMYHEHGDPLPYDHFPRHYLAGVLELGYRGVHFEEYRDLLWRGAWTSLFLQSPFGELPTGYRSSHHLWNEAEQCVTFELYARAYDRAGRTAEAGAFKRAARLSLASVTRWIRPDGSGYIVKNRYPIEARHGYESYSAHTCYNMLACSMLAQAWQYADESIVERPAPADVGGFVVPVLTPFHKIIANAGGAYAEFDTNGDQKYNPTGLIRVHVKDGHPQLGPSDGCASLFSGKDVSIAIGPSWQDAEGNWCSLAETSPAEPKLDILSQTPNEAAFQVTYERLSKQPSTAKVRLVSTVTVGAGSVTATDEITGNVQAMRIIWPMLVFDGEQETRIEIAGNSASLQLGSRGTRFTLLEPAKARLSRAGQRWKHRNGVVEPLVADFVGKRAVYRITAE